MFLILVRLLHQKKAQVRIIQSFYKDSCDSFFTLYFSITGLFVLNNNFFICFDIILNRRYSQNVITVTV